MTITNLDNTKIQNDELRNQLATALKENDEAKVSEAMVRMAEAIQANILAEAKSEARSLINTEINDREILNKRGLNVLTTEERNYYSKVIEKRGFTDLDVTMPNTIFDRVFEDLVQNHPLLSKITFQNTTAVTEWIVRKSSVAAAWWGKLTDPIKKELEGAFGKVQTDMYKLSAFMPVSKGMLDLGAQWLDKYVRTVLSESMSMALELGIVAGTGAEQPIGMMKDLNGAVVQSVYPDKAPVTLTDLEPNTLGTNVMAPLTKNGTRAVPNVLIIVNPLDYWQKIFGATTFLTQNGTYVYGVLPIPGDIVQSVAVPQGKMIAGVAKDYFMGVGSGSEILASDEYKFLEDERTYLIKQYANGRPQDADSFIVFDISGLNSNGPAAGKKTSNK